MNFKELFSALSFFTLFSLLNLNQLDAKICKSTKIFSYDFQKLKDCEIIKGSLIIAFLNRPNQTEEDLDLFKKSSLPKLVEVTEFVLFYQVPGIQSIGQILPNLSSIGGQKTALCNAALFVSELPDLEEVGLDNLKTISNGYIDFRSNPKLCPLAYDVQGVKVGCLKDNGKSLSFEDYKKDQCQQKHQNQQIDDSSGNYRIWTGNELHRIIFSKPKYAQTHQIIEQIKEFENYLEKDLKEFTSLLSEPTETIKTTTIINELEKMYQQISLSLNKTQEMLSNTLNKINDIKMIEHFNFVSNKLDQYTVNTLS